MLTQLHHRGRILFVFALLAVMSVTGLFAQGVNGTISGTVTDPSGAVVFGVA